MEDLLSKFIGNIVGPVAPKAAPAPVTPPTDPLHTFLSGIAGKAQANVDALKAKSPFLAKAGSDLSTIIHSTAGAVDESVKANAANVSDFVKGKLPVTAGDVGNGIMSTANGIGKIAQGFNAGIFRILKSAINIPAGNFAESPIGKLAANPLVGGPLKALGTSIAGDAPIHSYSEIYNKANDYAIKNQATPSGAKIFAGGAVLGSLFMDNPLFGAEGAGLKLGEDALKQIAKTDTEEGVLAILKQEKIPDEVAAHVAPVLAKTSTPEEVRAAVDQINQGVKTAKAVVEGTEPVERKFITSVKENVPVLGDRVAGQYIPRDTDALAQTARDLINSDIGKAEHLAATGTDDSAVATAVQLIKHYTQVAEEADAATRNALLDKAAQVANDTARKLTESGRAVQAASILGRLTPEGQVRFAAREIQKFNETAAASAKIPELTGEKIQQITAKVKTISQMPDGVDKAMEFQKFQQELADMVPTPMFKKLVTIWKAGLLTGLKTSGLNTFSNLFHGITEIVKDVPAVAIDKLASLATGKRTLALTPRGILTGGGEGVKKGWNYVKTGFDERGQLGKLDVHHVNFGSGPIAKAIQRYEETVFHTLGAEDQPFYYGAKAHSLASQAIAEAKNQGLKGAEATKFINDAVQNPTDEMIRNATLDAEVAVFQNDTALGRAAGALKEAAPLSEIILPFSKTPAAVAMQMFHYTPAGAVAEIATQIKRGTFNQRQFAQATGRAITGTAALYLGGQLLDNDMIALSRPTGEREQKEWELEGKQANSIKIGGQWRQVASLGPAGMVLLIGGYLQDGYKKSGSMWGALTEGAAGAGATLTQQTFLQGVDQFINAINDPVTYAHGYFTGLIGSLVPTIVGDVARGTDTAERRAPGLLDTAKAKIPGVRETLSPKVDTFGNVIAPPGFLATLADPTRPTKVSNDPAVLEIKRLTDAGYPSAPTQLGNKNGFSALTEKQNVALWEHTGNLIHSKLTNLFKSDMYQGLDDEAKAKMVAGFIDKSNTLSRAEMVLHLTNGLQGDALTKELSKLKAGGLMNRDVYNLYTSLR